MRAVKLQIVFHWTSKQERLLLDKAYLTPEPSEIQSAEIVAVDEYHTFIWIIDSQNEVNEGGFSTTRLSKHYVVSYLQLKCQIFYDCFEDTKNSHFRILYFLISSKGLNLFLTFWSRAHGQSLQKLSKLTKALLWGLPQWGLVRQSYSNSSSRGNRPHKPS